MQLHKRLTDEQVKAILAKYQQKAIKAKEAISYLGVGRTRFYQLVAEFEEQGSAFTLAYQRARPTRTISPSVEKHILAELEIEKTKIIDDPAVPTDTYNYSYVRQQVAEQYGEVVSVPTIITRAKNNGY